MVFKIKTKCSEPRWNCGYINSIPVNIGVPQGGDVLVYNDVSDEWNAAPNSSAQDSIQSSGQSTSVDTSTDNIVSTQNSQQCGLIDNTYFVASNRIFRITPNGTDIRLEVNDTNTSIFNTLTYQDGNEALGYVLQSDAVGNSSWVDPTTLTPLKIQSSTAATFVDTSGDQINIEQNNQVVETVDNTNHSLSSRVLQVRPNGTDIRFQVGNTRTVVSNTFQYTDGNQALGYILQSSATGDASWAEAVSVIQTPATGMSWVSNGATTTINVAGTFEKASVTASLTNLYLSRNSWDQGAVPGENLVRYTGSLTNKYIQISGAITVQSTANNQIIEASVYKNGSVGVGVDMRVQLTTLGDVSVIPLNYLDTVTTNDYFEVYVTSIGTTDGIIVTNGNLILTLI